MSIGREILKETRSLNEVEATHIKVNDVSSLKPGQVYASFQAYSDTGEQVYHVVVDPCDSLEELYTYTGEELKKLIDFIDNSVYFIDQASATIFGVSEVTSSTSYSYKKMGDWDIYRDGHYTDELDFAKEALGYE